jgi:hypothetical protein
MSPKGFVVLDYCKFIVKIIKYKIFDMKFSEVMETSGFSIFLCPFLPFLPYLPAEAIYFFYV